MVRQDRRVSRPRRPSGRAATRRSPCSWGSVPVGRHRSPPASMRPRQDEQDRPDEERCGERKSSHRASAGSTRPTRSSVEHHQAEDEPADRGPTRRRVPAPPPPTASTQTRTAQPRNAASEHQRAPEIAGPARREKARLRASPGSSAVAYSTTWRPVEDAVRIGDGEHRKPSARVVVAVEPADREEVRELPEKEDREEPEARRPESSRAPRPSPSGAAARRAPRRRRCRATSRASSGV